jgi:hypothetical protein
MFMKELYKRTEEGLLIRVRMISPNGFIHGYVIKNGFI